MILELFIVLIAITLVLIVAGYYMDMSELSVVGFAFLFILSSFVLLPGRLQYKVGETVENHPACMSCRNITSYYTDPVTNRTTLTTLDSNETYSYIASSTKVYEYASYNDTTTHYIGYFLSIISALGMIFVVIHMIYGGKQ